ncbi:MAG: SH3 domain-containing protein [Bdellovibrionia bacterium]
MGIAQSLIIFILCLGPICSYAAIPSRDSSAIPFFRSQNSQFPSGQSTLAALRNSALRSEEKHDFQVQWNKNTYRLRGHNITRDIQLSRHVKLLAKSPLFSKKDSRTPPLRLLQKEEIAQLIQLDDSWAQVLLPDGLVAYTYSQEIKPHFEDMGYALNFITTRLRQSPSMDSASLLEIPRGEKFIVEKFENAFIQITYANKKGYAPLDHFVLKADFATWAFSKSLGWSEIKYRQNSKFFLKSGKQLDLNEVQAMVTKPTWGMVTATEDTGPVLRSRVEIEKIEHNLWTLSRLKGHGEVWWKNPEFRMSPQPQIVTQNLKVSELLKKEIYSIAFADKKSIAGLLSSDGIYLSHDGENWNKLESFGDKNHPVAIHPDGPWFVGSHISLNQGKTFEPFVRWDQLAQSIEEKTGRAAKKITITKIEPLKDKRIQLHLDLGYETITMRAEIGRWHWQ